MSMKLAIILLVMGGATGLALAHEDFDIVESSNTAPQTVTPPQASPGTNYEQLYQELLNQERAKPIVLPGQENTSVNEDLAEGLPWLRLPVDIDTDLDGLSDQDEQRLGTSLDQVDSDGDSYEDGLELGRGYNPLVASPGDKVTYLDPSTASQVSELAISGVRLVDGGSQKLLVITGIAPANNVLALAVFSDEMKVWVLRADGSGRFKYSSADTLKEGDYRVMAAWPKVDGSFEGRSEPVEFSITAEGVSMKSNPFLEARRNPTDNGQPVSQRMIFVSLGIVVLVLVLSLAGAGLLIYWWMRRVRRKIVNRANQQWEFFGAKKKPDRE